MKKLCIFSILIFSLIILGCQYGAEEKKRQYQINDMLGRIVEVPVKVHKIIGVKAGALRLISYLDASEMVVGVEEIEKRANNPYNFAYPEYKDLPVIGPMHGGDAELIAVAKPDVIFMTYTTIDEADRLQKKTGIPVIALQYGDLSQNREIFYSAIQLMANIIHKSQRTDSLIHFIQTSIDDLDKRTKKIPVNERPVVYAGGISLKGSHGISSTSPDFPPFEFIHANCPASKYKSSSNNVFLDKEQLIEWNPQKIFIDYAGWNNVQEELTNEALYLTLKAIKNNELYGLLPYNWYTTNYASVLVNSYYAGTIIYPEVFTDIDIDVKADEIYNAFLGKSLYKQMSTNFGELKNIIINHE